MCILCNIFKEEFSWNIWKYMFIWKQIRHIQLFLTAYYNWYGSSCDHSNVIRSKISENRALKARTQLIRGVKFSF